MANLLKSRKATTYDSRKESAVQTFGPPDDRTLKVGYHRPAQIIRPPYKKGYLLFRPWPCIHYEKTDQLMGGRLSGDTNHYSEWCVKTRIAKYIGLEGGDHVTYNICLPTRTDEIGLDPYVILFRAATAAAKDQSFGNGKPWTLQYQKVIGTNKSERTQLPPINGVYFMAGTVFSNGDKQYPGTYNDAPLGLGDKDVLPVIQVSGSAWDKALEMFNADGEATRQVPENDKWAKGRRFNDPVGIFDKATRTVTGGYLFTVYNASSFRGVRVRSPENPKGAYLATTYTPNPNLKGESIGYDVAISGAVKTATTTARTEMSAPMVEKVLAKSAFWLDDEASGDPGLLFFPTIDERAAMVARVYLPVKGLVINCWHDHPEFMTDEVRGIFAARKAIQTGGTPASEAAKTEALDDDVPDAVDPDADLDAAASPDGDGDVPAAGEDDDDVDVGGAAAPADKSLAGVVGDEFDDVPAAAGGGVGVDDETGEETPADDDVDAESVVDNATETETDADPDADPDADLDAAADGTGEAEAALPLSGEEEAAALDDAEEPPAPVDEDDDDTPPPAPAKAASKPAAPKPTAVKSPAATAPAGRNAKAAVPPPSPPAKTSVAAPSSATVVTPPKMAAKAPGKTPPAGAAAPARKK